MALPLFVQPVLTCRGTWLDAVNYYAEHYGKIMEDQVTAYRCYRIYFRDITVFCIYVLQPVPSTSSTSEVRGNILNQSYNDPVLNNEFTNSSSQPVSSTSSTSDSLHDNFDLQYWDTQFNTLARLDVSHNAVFDKCVEKYCHYLKQSVSQCKGPQHPATTYYKKRQARKNNPDGITYKQSSNPKNRIKKNSERRKNKYAYDLAQFNYYFQRRKIVQHVLSSKGPMQCKLPVSSVYEYYNNLYGVANNCTLDNYHLRVSNYSDPDNIIITLKILHLHVRVSRLTLHQVKMESE
ncbi:hypothetical protein ANN_26672 [Periplaneta americana]|uniref:Uncharacterized protein n=1 Tax=Periplaneta americana TaxID=6978 RepID=A0ABQ8RYV1_PERAM|nr:hypothetical protein ANN_26672 [Periplaneta americana]